MLPHHATTNKPLLRSGYSIATNRGRQKRVAGGRDSGRTQANSEKRRRPEGKPKPIRSEQNTISYVLDTERLMVLMRRIPLPMDTPLIDAPPTFIMSPPSCLPLLAMNSTKNRTGSVTFGQNPQNPQNPQNLPPPSYRHPTNMPMSQTVTNCHKLPSPSNSKSI